MQPMAEVPSRRSKLSSQVDNSSRAGIATEAPNLTQQLPESEQESPLGQSHEETGDEMQAAGAAGASSRTSTRSSQSGHSGILRPDGVLRQRPASIRGSEDEAQARAGAGSHAADASAIEAVSVDHAISMGYPDLNFRFTPLKTWFLILTVTLWLLIIGTIFALISLQLSQPGILHVREAGNYYAVRYGPGVVGTVTSIWWRSIVQSYNRLFPYVVMANQPMLEEDGVEVVAAHRLNHISADTIDIHAMEQLVKGGHWTAVAVSVFGVGIPLILVSIKTGLLQITEDQAGWGITVDPKIGYAIIALYSALCLTSLAVLIQLWGKKTGLKWNPCSLASQLALVHMSNVFQAFEGMEFCNKLMTARRTRAWPGRYGHLRIGYWRHTKEAGNEPSGTLFHGIRFIKSDGIQSREDDTQSTNTPNTGRHRNEIERDGDLHPYALGGDSYSEAEAPVALLSEYQADSWRWARPLGFYRYLWSGGSFYMNDFFVTVTMLLILLGLVALAIALATGTVLKPVSYANSSALYFQSTRNIILNTLPAFVLNLGSIIFLQSDTYHRMLQPIRGMDKPATAQQSLLLDYMSPDPLSVIITAVSNGHYRIAWGSFLAMICSTGPIVAGGMFTVDPGSETFRAAPSSAYLVLGILCLYNIAIPLARPGAKYAAGRGLWNIIDTLSFCYDSPVRGYPEFSAQGRSDGEVHLRSQVVVARRLYQFGYYMGLSGRRRMGFGETKPLPGATPDGGPGQGTPVPPQGVDRVKSRYGFLRFNLVWFRRPELVCSEQRLDVEMQMSNTSEGGRRRSGPNQD